ncbi:MAG: glycosyltransferase family 39 protein [Xanthomonadales bacterium]|nr:Undecaprenyl phosphate-alpha-4-amino-4-deoxy-L-arabinose arabinosyl transferase [Xanthomonadales bacterium]MCC6592744.1 glycosyltransferase family 39 protein [Xanthomonadales bacterium]MCE7931255.1 glycosyltransferase [Xanthomonadales bacterium PRO6]
MSELVVPVAAANVRVTVRSPVLWTLLLALLLALSFQGERGLWGPDEGRYSNIALQMIESGDWLTPRRHPEHAHFAKPPLTCWAMAASVLAFGANEAALRLPNALSLLATVVLLMLLGRRLLPAAPWLPGLVFATSLVPFVAAHLINADFLLTTFETLAVYGYVRLWQARDGADAAVARRWMWLGFALAFLTKGPPGLLPLLPLLAHRRTLPQPHPALLDRPSATLFVLLALPWYLVVVIANPGLLGYFLGYEVYARVFTAVHDRNGHWYGAIEVYLPVLLLGLMPWSWRLLRRLPALPRRAAAWRDWWAARAPEDRFLLLWLLLPLVVFCLARSRLPLYLLPLLAPMALLAARRWRVQEAGEFRLAWRTALLAAALLLALKALLPLLLPHAKDTRALAVELRRHWTDPGEVVFVDESALYGLRFYLRVPVARVSMTARADPTFDRTLAEVLGEAERRLFITTTERLPRLRQTLSADGWRFRERTRFERYVAGDILRRRD